VDFKSIAVGTNVSEKLKYLVNDKAILFTTETMLNLSINYIHYPIETMSIYLQQLISKTTLPPAHREELARHEYGVSARAGCN
jgi:hypothetical protein